MASHHQALPLRQALVRSCAEEGLGARAVRLQPRTFYPFRVVENGRTLPLVVDCASLDEAVEGAKVHCFHKEHLLIREVGEGCDKFHIYAIKQKSTPRYVHRDHVTRAVRDLYAAKVCTFDAGMLG
jgi:hypothetical protein